MDRLAVLLLVLLAGCKRPSSDANESAPVATEEKKKPEPVTCKYLTQEELVDAVGRSAEFRESSRDDGCAFSATAVGYGGSFRFDDYSKNFWDSRVQAGNRVADLGDDAVWGPQALFVKKGDRFVHVIVLGESELSARDRAIALAKKLLPKMQAAGGPD